MGWLLQSLGRRFALYNASGLPPAYAWVRLPQPLLASLDEVPFTPQLLVTLDCGDMRRLGPEADRLAMLPAIHLDHHLGNPHAALPGSWVEPDMAATGHLVAEAARAAGLPLSGGLAEGVALALASDTGAFAFSNTDAAVFRLMAELLDEGLEFALLRERMESQWSLAKSALWGRLTGKVESRFGGRLMLCVIRREDLDACGAVSEDLDGFVEHLRRHRHVKLAVTLREDAPARCKLSLRSFGAVDARAPALRFGGGGHKNAAGATICEPVDAVLEKIIAAARDVVDCDG
jgi:phosphoesterase RecJ-like protein